ncbi:hypothetical protein GSI_13324 [Ganoderma sinense ZZ0214-1]|uniref:CxC2-like cysteine cluster KDZ transposase-associated domain-containing protein n=1 Tax=Ganoderma sinense ZZ0214-1 TaxID=1077348 RepID=A0A2G8RVC1_9APHY|nr:hypothetical protein GSI_13324 [Ganoderma sinense ZZ0214-1]
MDTVDGEEEPDEEIPYLVEDPDSDFEDEDGDIFYRAHPDRLVPQVADLPWFGEGPRRSPSSHGTLETFRNDQMVVVVDIEGIHELLFTFCLCRNAPTEDLQLLDLGYYPASSIRPCTVFMRRLLDDFLLANRECKTSPQNYYNKLRRITNPAFPHMVPDYDAQDRYKELLRVSQQWQIQQMRKMAGFGHRDDPIGHRDLAIQCPAPACPQPGINLPESWKTDPEQWKYTRSVVMDGNFSTQHRKMCRPEDDVALADGHAFMVEDTPYKEHLKTAKEYKELPLNARN